MRQVSGLAFLVCALAASCGSATSTKLNSEKTITVTAPAAGSSSTATTTTSAAAPNPDGHVSGSCDMLLNSNFDSSVTGWLVATIQIRNTGNIGIKVNAKAAWQQAGSASIVKVRPLRVKIGRQKAAHFRIPITQDQVSAFQSAPGYSSGNTPCGITGTITGTFGSAR